MRAGVGDWRCGGVMVVESIGQVGDGRERQLGPRRDLQNMAEEEVGGRKKVGGRGGREEVGKEEVRGCGRKMAQESGR